MTIKHAVFMFDEVFPRLYPPWVYSDLVALGLPQIRTCLSLCVGTRHRLISIGHIVCVMLKIGSAGPNSIALDSCCSFLSPDICTAGMYVLTELRCVHGAGFYMYRTVFGTVPSPSALGDLRVRCVCLYRRVSFHRRAERAATRHASVPSVGAGTVPPTQLASSQRRPRAQ